MSHKHILEKASKALAKDAKHYISDEKKTKSPIKKKHDRVEHKEAAKDAKITKKLAKKAHEY